MNKIFHAGRGKLSSSVVNQDSLAPVLLIFWDRAETLRENLARIHQSGHRRIYIAGDGPRANDAESTKRVQSAREVIGEFSWQEPPRLLLHSDNQGARRAILKAIDWFFSQEGMGIVLEDDSIPNLAFFRFCDELLVRFRHEPSVLMISGTNPVKFELGSSYSYRFSSHHHIWGFASWGDRVRRVLSEIKALESSDLEPYRDSGHFLSESERKLWLSRVAKELSGRDDNWDSSWNLCAKRLGLISVVPQFSMVKNMGYEIDSLHTKKLPLIAGSTPDSRDVSFPLNHPPRFEVDSQLDLYVSRVQWAMQALWSKIPLALAEATRRSLRVLLSSRKPSQFHTTVSEEFWWWRYRRIKNAK